MYIRIVLLNFTLCTVFFLLLLQGKSSWMLQLVLDSYRLQLCQNSHDPSGTKQWLHNRIFYESHSYNGVRFVATTQMVIPGGIGLQYIKGIKSTPEISPIVYMWTYSHTVSTYFNEVTNLWYNCVRKTSMIYTRPNYFNIRFTNVFM